MSGTEPPRSPLDPHRQVLIAYAEIGICNPLSFATLDRVLAEARLPPGARTLDLGCGNAVVSRHLAERWRCAVEALERSPAVCAIARETLAGLGGSGGVTLHEAASADWLPGQEPFTLAVALGVSGVVGGPPEPRRVLGALRPHVAEGGWLLWGDPYYRRPPSEPLRALLGANAAYLSHAENVAAGEGAGFVCVRAATSTEQDDDDYIWRILAASDRWLRAHPDHAEAESVRHRGRILRASHLAEGREALGFGLYLFRAA